LFGVFSLVMAGQSESSSGLQRVAIGLAALPRLW
jgi:hypothetical protein